MVMDRFTQRAKDVLLNLPSDKKVTANVLLDAIVKVSGMGAALIKVYPGLSMNKNVKIDIGRLVKEAFYQSVKLESTYVGTEHILLAMLKILSSTDTERVKQELIKMNIFPNTVKSIEKGRKTPLLDSFSEDLNQKVFKDFERPILFRDEYNTLVSVLLQKNNTNALLVGDNGVGKSSVIELLARNINTMDVPPLLSGYHVLEFDLMAFMTNIINKGGVDISLNSLADELRYLGRTIISISNFQSMFFATNAGFTVPVFYSMFKSAIETTGTKLIATMTPSLYEKIAADNEHVLENFSVIEVDEPDEAYTLKLLLLNAKYLGMFHSVDIPDEVVKYVYKKAKQELKDLKFPQKGLDLLDQACARLVMKKTKFPERYKKLVDKTFFLAQRLDKSIASGDFDSAVKSRNLIKRNEDKLLKEEKEIFTPHKLKLGLQEVDDALLDMGIAKKPGPEDIDISNLTDLAEKIKRKIIGQDHAVDTVVKSLVRSRLGLRSKKRPLGNFLFLGPTGVGKTELAKVLSEVFFPSKETNKPGSLVRLDMSDFAEKHNVARLVGAPPGYVGYGEGGELTQKIELNPQSVVLFDEIEKAHPDVLNILLQIMEEGELSDARGNVFDFSKAVVILTSNLGTDLIQSAGIGFEEKIWTDDKVEDRLKGNLKKILKPELLNRFDEIIVFKKLNQKDQMNILNLLISEVSRTLKLQNVLLRVNLPSKQYLLKKGYSDEYGARSLRRTIEKELLDKVAERLLNDRNRPLTLKTQLESSNLTLI